MRLGTIASGLALGVGLTVAACGGTDSPTPPNELVRVHIQDTLEFRMDATDGQEDVFPVDATFAVDRDGHGTTTVVEPSPNGPRAFELSARELERLKDALADLDLDELQRRFGATAGRDGTTTITYRGQTVALDNRFQSPTAVKGVDQARRLSALMLMLDDITVGGRRGDASPGRGSVGAEPSR